MSTPGSDLHSRIRKRRREIQRRRMVDAASLLALGAALLLIFSTGLAGGRRAADEGSAPAAVVIESPTPAASPTVAPTLEASPTPEPIPTAEPTPTPLPPLVGVLAGHRNNDSGAVCEEGPFEGLREVDVTTDIAARLVPLLEEKGYRVLDLDEFDERLFDLEVEALLSLHADSCVEWDEATGYKAARSVGSAIPAIEDRFVDCVNQEYAAATGLPYHPGSITHNMTNYHVFRKIAPDTPAVIVELGFLHQDNTLLTENQELVVEGLMRGLDCFVDSRELATPEP